MENNLVFNETVDFNKIQYIISQIVDEHIILKICNLNDYKEWDYGQKEEIFKYKIKPNEIMDYVQNYKLDLKERILNFSKFKKINS